jgi:diguanylate cyclase (GGDEF)-like protein/PAS domain S-box-containing protein
MNSDELIADLKKRIAELEAEIKEYKESEEMLFRERELFEELAATVPDVLYRINMRTGQYEYLSPALESMLGYSLSEPLQHPREFTLRVMHPDDRDRISLEVQKHLTEKKGDTEPLIVECRMVRSDGRILWIRDSMRFEWDGDQLMAANGIMSDITGQRVMEDELRSLSLTDELTGLYNRRAFHALGEQQLRLARRLNKKVHIYFIDIDCLKQINDQYGHHEGDKALFETAYILRSTYRESDIVARYGGDEFSVLTIQTQDVGNDNIETRLDQAVNEFNRKKLYPYPISLSIGHCFFDPASPVSLDELLARADHLMYQNKKLNHEQTI